MAKTLYTAHATVTGGRNGKGTTSNGALELTLRRPVEMGGEGGGTNPEELFAVGYAACFEGALGAVARRLKIEEGEVTIHSQVSLTPTGTGGFFLSVVLDVSIPGVDDTDTKIALIKGAHEVCPYSNATRGNIEVELLLDGEKI